MYNDLMLEEYNPTSELLLAESAGNPLAADAMSLSWQLREEEGLSPSESLRKAWQIVKGETSLNPFEGNVFQPSPLLTILVIAGIGIGVYKWKKGCWPWEAAGIARQKAEAVARAQRIMRANARPQQSQALGSTSVILPRPPGRMEAEEVSLICP